MKMEQIHEPAPVSLEEPQAVSLFVGLMPWVFVVILQKRMGKEKFLGIKQSNKNLASSN